ncbi:hypothetical protein AWB78_07558 [Caballeronia calidae]|uniref:Uncharacterized protein n=1 Tax=Caballeronia calidae TaxID=1777139 RepID=A0A158EFA0_9BURK|nr:hypothetical protein [Caballeronia calidae]SAL05545.1 hypothetical protein AWB78_07558 [Caballeronia calidae]
MPKLSKETLDFRKLKCNFVNEVLRNLSNTGDPLATVSFGTSGGGIQPNYEITPVSGEPVAYRGNTHQAVEDRDQWSAGNLTEPFSRDEVEQGFDISLKSIDVAKKYILDNLKAHPEKYSHPGKDHASLLIEAVMGGTPLTKAFADLYKVQNTKPFPQTETAPVHRDTERLISNEALSLSDIPHADAPYEEVVRFGHTFDGYRQMGSFEACAAVAHAKKHGTLSELRACLFFEQRASRHSGEDPDETGLAYEYGLLEKIRQKVIENARD